MTATIRRAALRTPSARTLAVALLASSALVPSAALAQAAPVLPTGGTVTAGSATIASSQAGVMHITQASDRAIINWQGFSIGEGGRVDIAQPNVDAALLNRVTGSATSEIAGQINANGRVFLVNPNGIVITRTGSVNAAGFTASTLDIADRDFMAGSNELTVTGRRGAVTIGAAEGGYAGLIGGRTPDGELIRARLASGAALDLTGDGFLQVALPASGINVAGTINASEVVLRAGTAREAARQTVNLTGTIRATGIDARGGTVVLTGDTVTLAGATIDASGALGGGTVRIGGDYQGGGTLAHATRLDVDDASRIRADATDAGDGGTIVLWSDEATRFAGRIGATGAGTGRGGDAEVSGKARLAFTGTADLRGSGGFGTLLLDPYDVTISDGSDSNQTGFTATGNDSVINHDTLQNALASADVVISTGSGGGQVGNITLAAGAPLTWNSSATLTLAAAGAVTLNSAIRAGAGGLTINSGSGVSTATASVSIARFTLAAGHWVQSGTNLPAFASGDFRVTSGSSFLRVAGGTGTNSDPYVLNDIYGVQGMGTSTSFLAAHYQLGRDVDAGDTPGWRGGKGFMPIGSADAPFIGSLSGANHAISGLTIAQDGSDFAGLIGYLGTGGRISAINLVGVNVLAPRGGGLVGSSMGEVTGVSVAGEIAGVVAGGVIGYAGAGTLSQSHFSGSVRATGFKGNSIGGLIGYVAAATVSQSHAEGSINGSSGDTGGLVGYLGSGTITQSHAKVAVAGNNVGGLVGANYDGTVEQSYATGSVAAFGPGSNVGGLIGSNQGVLSASYAANAIDATQALAGGVVAKQLPAGTLIDNYWDIGRSGQAMGVGDGADAGTTGLTSIQAGDADSYAGFDFTNIWYHTGDLRPMLRSEAAPKVGGVYQLSNLHQLQLMGLDLGGSYVLTGTIDARDMTNDVFNAGFIPVGTRDRPFNGSLSGGGYAVSEIEISRGVDNNTGLIGYSAGTISDIGVTGGARGGDSVGILVGWNDGIVSRSYGMGSVNGDVVGGLVGTNSGTVSQSFARQIGVSGGTVGGLVGNNTGTIRQSYAKTYDVVNTVFGALAGRNSGSVDDLAPVSPDGFKRLQKPVRDARAANAF